LDDRVGAKEHYILTGYTKEKEKGTVLRKDVGGTLCGANLGGQERFEGEGGRGRRRAVREKKTNAFKSISHHNTGYAC